MRAERHDVRKVCPPRTRDGMDIKQLNGNLHSSKLKSVGISNATIEYPVDEVDQEEEK